MYDFRIETELTAFDNFVKANKGSYLQCLKWPKVKTSWGLLLTYYLFTLTSKNPWRFGK